MADSFNALQFAPDVSHFLAQRTSSRITTFSGLNNCGKSSVLKKLALTSGQTMAYIGVNRFYHFHTLNYYQQNDSEMNDRWHNFINQTQQRGTNFETLYFDPQRSISRLNNEERNRLFQHFTRVFGQSIEIKKTDPDNDLSERYVSVDGDSLSITSSGTRLFLIILASMMDARFRSVAIDEPELGLSPSLQSRLMNIFQDDKTFLHLFPHNPSIFLSTHSHIFLDRKNIANNYLVSKSSDQVRFRTIETITEFNDLQFRLLGNDLGTLFLPDLIVFCEGPTDEAFITRTLSVAFPNKRIVVRQCGGDLAARIIEWSKSVGDMQRSPYRDRTLIITDSVKQAGLDRAIVSSGLPKSALITWDNNGIEYVYPTKILKNIFSTSISSANDLYIVGDDVHFAGISYKKAELSRLVINYIDGHTEHSLEFYEKLHDRVASILS